MRACVCVCGAAEWTRSSWRRCSSICTCCSRRRTSCPSTWTTTSSPPKLTCCPWPSPRPGRPAMATARCVGHAHTAHTHRENSFSEYRYGDNSLTHRHRSALLLEQLHTNACTYTLFHTCVLSTYLQGNKNRSIIPQLLKQVTATPKVHISLSLSLPLPLLRF